MKNSPQDSGRFRSKLLPVQHGFGLTFSERDLVDPLWLICHQVHSTEVLVCDSTHSNSLKADGLILSTKGSIAIQTADCLPVLFSTRDGRAVAAVHAGWRGALDGILPNAVQKLKGLGIPPEELLVAIGPCLRQCCFEISNALVSDFETKWGGLWKNTEKPYSSKQPVSTRTSHQAKPLQENIWMNLAEVAQLQLRDCGVREIDELAICTYCHTDKNNEKLPSHRRATHEKNIPAGRLWSFISK